MTGKIQRIAIVGAESTGKTWLAAELAAMLARQGRAPHLVPEVLREWCDREGRTPASHEQQAIAREQARRVLAAQAPQVVVADTTPLMTAVYSHLLFQDESLYDFALEHQRQYDITLLTGLDLPWTADGLQRDGPHVREPVDTLLRSALARAGVAYQVVYGQGPQRLENARLALDRAASAAHPGRASGQFGLQGGRMPWSCEKCSDPACEHRLFTGLLGR
jgi:HTH-type transcriptional regulator, transcriptional repressor of NAD biosynthesis genes